MVVCVGSNTVDYLVMGGGGGGGTRRVVEVVQVVMQIFKWRGIRMLFCWTKPFSRTALPVLAQTYPIAIGGGGAGNSAPGPGNPNSQASAE